jgi:hypothetical protein
VITVQAKQRQDEDVSSTLDNCGVFSNANQAQAAWTAGIYLGTPTRLSQYGATVGKSMALGDNALTFTLQNLWVASWSKGSSYSVFITNYGSLTAGQLPGKVAGRI